MIKRNQNKVPVLPQHVQLRNCPGLLLVSHPEEIPDSLDPPRRRKQGPHLISSFHRSAAEVFVAPYQGCAPPVTAVLPTCPWWSLAQGLPQSCISMWAMAVPLLLQGALPANVNFQPLPES